MRHIVSFFHNHVWSPLIGLISAVGSAWRTIRPLTSTAPPIVFKRENTAIRPIVSPTKIDDTSPIWATPKRLLLNSIDKAKKIGDLARKVFRGDSQRRSNSLTIFLLTFNGEPVPVGVATAT